MNIVGKYGSIKEIPNVKEILNCERELTLDDVDNACDGIGIDHENRFDIFFAYQKEIKR